MHANKEIQHNLFIMSVSRILILGLPQNHETDCNFTNCTIKLPKITHPTAPCPRIQIKTSTNKKQIRNKSKYMTIITALLKKTTTIQHQPKVIKISKQLLDIAKFKNS